LELVYLWVEDYKNIHKQGFNFSPRFHCDYDSDSNVLTIDENDDYIENFFGDNINVTAIVGKNGSGKSSLLELIFLIKNEKLTKEGFYIFFDKKNECFVKSEKELVIKAQKEQYGKNLSFIEKISYIDVSHFKNDIFNNSTINTINDFKYQLQGTSVTTSSEYEDILHDSHKLFKTFQIYPQLRMLDNIDIRKYIIELFQIPEPIYIKISLADDYDEHGSLKDKLSENDNEIISNLISNGEYIDDELIINISYKENINEFLNLLYEEIDCCLYICLLDEKKNEIYFSSGEQIILYYLGIFFRISDEIRYIIIDEIDLYLHPTWQKEILNIIITFLNFKKRTFNIILTTHSPFLLSDIPKQNIIFLDTDEEGKCKVVDGLKEKKQTFGANIHTLLSDSFFMEDGLMGEFAKGKIDKAITLLNQEYLSDEELKYCEQIISIIGEPIVKNQLQRMLDSKRLKKIDEIDAIKSSMEAMQKRLDELEK